LSIEYKQEILGDTRMSNIIWKLKSLWFYRRQWIPIFKAGLYVLWFFWALQFCHPLKESWVDEMQYQKNRNLEIERQDRLKIKVFVKDLIKKAEDKGVNYNPTDYFNDLKKITERCQLGERTIPRPQITLMLQRLSWDSVNKGYYDQKEISKQADIFQNWLIEKNLGSEPKDFDYRKRLSWLGLLYLKTMFLAVILYFARMGERKGILAAILADKKKFVLAIIAWPALLYKYPYNIVREIKVEAELRRIKGLFKKLSLKEIGLVREIANSDNYHLWIKNYRKQHKAELQRGLFVAILATLFIHIFFVSFAKAKDRSFPEKTAISVISIETDQNFQEDDSSEHHDFGNQYALIEEEFSEPPLFLWVVQFVKENFWSRCPEILDRIPRNSLFSVVNRLINQTVKGTKNECDKDFFVLSGISFCQLSLCSQSCRSHRHL